jgi:hypothetical protein
MEFFNVAQKNGQISLGNGPIFYFNYNIQTTQCQDIALFEIKITVSVVSRIRKKTCFFIPIDTKFTLPVQFTHKKLYLIIIRAIFIVNVPVQLNSN